MRSVGDHLIILSGDHLYRMDYQKFFRHHLEKDADISIAVKPIFETETSGFGILKVDEKGVITEFYEKPNSQEILDQYRIAPELFDHFHIEAKNRSHVASMGIYIFKKEVLFKILQESDKEDFGKEIIPSSLNNHKVVCYFFDGYWEDIGTVRTFFDAHLNLTQPVPLFNFYDEEYPFFTRPRYLPASKTNNCHINQSIIAEGSILLGSIIEQAVIGIRSYVDEGTLIQRSILMGNSQYETIENRMLNQQQNRPNLGIGRNCIIKNAIIDLDCSIGNNVQLINKDNQSEVMEESYCIRDGIIIIPKGTVIGDNTII
jgi:glucose-1-phosphate adenylyltransferase